MSETKPEASTTEEVAAYVLDVTEVNPESEAIPDPPLTEEQREFHAYSEGFSLRMCDCAKHRRLRGDATPSVSETNPDALTYEQLAHEIDLVKRKFAAEVAGRQQIREQFGARDDETFPGFVARLYSEREEARAGRDAAVEALGVMRDELVLAGFPAGDRTVALANLRALVAERDALKAREAKLREALEKIARPGYGIEFTDTLEEQVEYWTKRALCHQETARAALAPAPPPMGSMGPTGEAAAKANGHVGVRSDIREHFESDWLARHDAEVRRKALEDARDWLKTKSAIRQVLPVTADEMFAALAEVKP